MMQKRKELSSNQILSDSTGNKNIESISKTVYYPLGKYQVGVKLGPNNEFLGVFEIKVNASFISHSQNTLPEGYHDVEKYYLE